MKIYHNNRCSKSRQCLSLLSNSNVEVIDYIKNPLTFDELSSLISKIGIQPAELIRTNEAIWKEKFKGKKMSGQMGNVKSTTQNLTVVSVDVDKNLLLIKGAVPGCPGGDIIIRPAIKAN